MASKAKTNFISYELKQLEEYYEQLNNYLKNNPPDLAEDRVEHMVSPKGTPMIKVIASREVQIKLFTETLEKLPKILNDLNTLRKTVAGEPEKNVRGGADIPGFMDADDDDDDDKNDYVIQKPANKETVFEDEDDVKETKPELKSLPAPAEEKDEIVYDFTKTDDISSEDETEEYWQDEDLEDE